MTEKITAYKGFDKNMKCRDFQFEVGKTYEHNGKVSACNSGFHSCENPFDVLNYYPIENGNRFAVVKVDGELSRHDGDSKIASAKITIEAELSWPDLFQACVKYIQKVVEPSGLLALVKGKVTHTDSLVVSKKKEDKIGTSGYSTQIGTSGDSTQIGTSGYSTQIGTSGDSTQIGTSGDSTKIGTSGDSTKIGTSGDSTKIGTSGSYTKIGTSGSYTKIGTSGYNTQIGTSGYSTQIGTSGDSTQIGTSGDSTKIGTSGDSTKIGTSGSYTKIGTSGYNTQIGTSGYNTQIGTSGYNTQIGTSGSYTKIGTSGYNTQIEQKGEHAVIACVHAASKVKGDDGTLVCLVHYDKDNKTPLKFVTGTIGKGVLKKVDAWYGLDKDGKFVEVKNV